MRSFNRAVKSLFDRNEVQKGGKCELYMQSCTPDDHPVIGPLAKYPNLFINGGHGQRISSLSLASGELVAQMVEGKDVDEYKFVKPKRYLI